MTILYHIIFQRIKKIEKGFQKNIIIIITNENQMRWQAEIIEITRDSINNSSSGILEITTKMIKVSGDQLHDLRK